MLYLHCGWPRTSTTGLQRALFESRDELASSGVLFPQRWMTPELTHHGISALATEAVNCSSAMDDLKAFLSCNAVERDVVLSAEILTTFLLSPERQSGLLAFLRAVRDAAPVTCVWTLRRLDDAIHSFYLRRLVLGIELPPPAQYFSAIRNLDGFFAGMRRTQEAGGVVYVEYHSSGSHNGELLRAFDLPRSLRERLMERLATAPRLNESLRHKQAVALSCFDAVASRAGIDLDRAAMEQAFLRGDFQFTADRRSELVDTGARAALHERALAAASSQGFVPYGDFFGRATIEPVEPLRIDPDVLTDEDLQRLARDFGRGGST